MQHLWLFSKLCEAYKEAYNQPVVNTVDSLMELEPTTKGNIFQDTYVCRASFGVVEKNRVPTS